jgi:hypothetical protein
MFPLAIGILCLVLLLWALRAFTKADAQTLVAIGRRSGGIAALLGATFLTFRGQIGLALPLGFAGLALLGWLPFGPAGVWQRTQKSPGLVSRVRSAFVEMELDHDTGVLRGRILAGRYEGMALDALDLAILVGLLSEIDEESRALLGTYLDRRHPAWREHAEGNATAGQSAFTRSGPMTEQEAYQILGVEPGASATEIGRAHRALMKKLHPDQGGSTYLAARVNEAKEILLRRHR